MAANLSMQDSPPPPPVDPNLATEQQRAQDELVGSLQKQTQGDMANLMARYGSMLALSGRNISPLAVSSGFNPAGAAFGRAA